MSTETLASWNDGDAKTAIVDFVERVTREDSADFVPVAERIAVFDNDGTLWCEKPMPIELGFILKRMAEMAQEDPALREQQPFQAAYAGDHAWLGGAITKHYQGDDSDVKTLIGGLVRSFSGWPVDRYQTEARTFLDDGQHPTLSRAFSDCGYVPMIELLRYLETHDFTVYIASGGNRDFMRSVTYDIYGIPAERVVGSSSGLQYHDGAVTYAAQLDFFDDGPIKPVRIWSRVGARPLIAVGNSNGDTEMLEWSANHPRPSLQLLVVHDDDEREFAYVAGAEAVMKRADADNWPTISMKNDWTTVFRD